MKCKVCNNTGWMTYRDTRDPDLAKIPCKYCSAGDAIRDKQRRGETIRDANGTVIWP